MDASLATTARPALPARPVQTSARRGLAARALAAGVALAAAFGFAIAAPGVGRAQDANNLNFYNWSDYIAEDTIPTFEKETGIHVVYDMFDSNDVVEGKLLAGNTGYDIVVPTGNFLGRQIQAGVFQKLDKSKLTNWDNLDPNLLKQLEQFDPGNEYGVPYMWGTNGVGYNVDMIKKRMPDAPIGSLRMVFDPEVVKNFADCGVAYLDSPADVLPMALYYLGLDPNSDKAEDYEKVAELLAKVRPHIRYFHSSSYIDDLAAGQICLAIGWSGDVFQAIDDAREGTNIAYFIPEEGTALWFDIMAIPVDAPHPDNAHKMINYLLQPEVVANITNTVFFSNPNKASLPLVNAEIRDDPAIYPPEDVLAKLYVVKPETPALRRTRTRLWTRLKSGS